MTQLTDDQYEKVISALATGREFTAEALNDFYEKFDDHPAMESGAKIIQECLTEILEAIKIMECVK